MPVFRFGLVVLASVMFAQTPPVPAPLQGVHRIVMLGDSITQQGENPGGYVWLTRQYLQRIYPTQKIEVINAGISGHRSTEMIDRFQKDVLDQHPDLVTISVGVNDVWHGFYDNHPAGDGPRGIKLEDYRRNVEDMVSRAEGRGAKIVILSATPIYEDLKNRENAKEEKYNSALRDIARRHNAIFVDYQRPMRKLIDTYRRSTGARDNFLTTDGVHMNSSGNEVMAHTLLSALGVPPEARAAVQADVNKAKRQ